MDIVRRVALGEKEVQVRLRHALISLLLSDDACTDLVPKSQTKFQEKVATASASRDCSIPGITLSARRLSPIDNVKPRKQCSRRTATAGCHRSGTRTCGRPTDLITRTHTRCDRFTRVNTVGRRATVSDHSFFTGQHFRSTKLSRRSSQYSSKAESRRERSRKRCVLAEFRRCR